MLSRKPTDERSSPPVPSLPLSGRDRGRPRVRIRREHVGVALLSAGAFFGHVVWPCVALLLARAAGEKQPVSLHPPGVRDSAAFASVVIPAYQEVHTIGPAVRRLLTAERTAVDEVVVVADDDLLTAAAASAAGARVISGMGRTGKSGAINRGVAHAQNDVVLLMDANTDMDGDAVRRLADHVRDGRLDLAGGVRVERGDAGQGFYWRFENHTKAAEHRLGGCLSLVGEAIALRRSLFRPIPSWVKGDDTFLAVDFAERGLRVSVDTDVVASEPSVTPREQFERRIRILSANHELLWRNRRAYLTPSRAMLMLHAHKTWRSTGGPVCQLALTGWAVRHGRSPLAQLWVAANVLAAADYAGCASRNYRPGMLRSVTAQALGMPPVVFSGALYRLAQRASAADTGVWTKIER